MKKKEKRVPFHKIHLGYEGHFELESPILPCLDEIKSLETVVDNLVIRNVDISTKLSSTLVSEKNFIDRSWMREDENDFDLERFKNDDYKRSTREDLDQSVKSTMIECAFGMNSRQDQLGQTEIPTILSDATRKLNEDVKMLHKKRHKVKIEDRKVTINRITPHTITNYRMKHGSIIARTHKSVVPNYSGDESPCIPSPPRSGNRPTTGRAHTQRRNQPASRLNGEGSECTSDVDDLPPVPIIYLKHRRTYIFNPASPATDNDDNADRTNSPSDKIVSFDIDKTPNSPVTTHTDVASSPHIVTRVTFPATNQMLQSPPRSQTFADSNASSKFRQRPHTANSKPVSISSGRPKQSSSPSPAAASDWLIDKMNAMLANMQHAAGEDNLSPPRAQVYVSRRSSSVMNEAAMKRKEADEKNLSVELTYLFNGYQELDKDSDGFVSAQDISAYCDLYNIQLSHSEINQMMWLIDDKCKGKLIFDDIKYFYFRFREQLLKSGEPYLIKNSNRDSDAASALVYTSFLKSLQPEENNENRGAAVSSFKEKLSTWDIHLQPLLFIRLLFFASNQDASGSIHLLTSYQNIIQLFGKFAERIFCSIFCRRVDELTDSDRMTASELVNFIKYITLKSFSIHQKKKKKKI